MDSQWQSNKVKNGIFLHSACPVGFYWGVYAIGWISLVDIKDFSIATFEVVFYWAKNEKKEFST